MNNNIISYEDKVKDILVDFSCLFDTDYGTLGYLIYHYPKSKYFLDGYKDWTVYFTKCKVISREDINPLTAILKPEYIDQAKNLYDEIFRLHWEEVLRISPQTDIVKVIYKVYHYAGYNITVNCRNELETNWVKSHVSDWSTVVQSKLENKYFCFFLHDAVKKVAELKKLEAKCIYVYLHKPNFINYKERVMHVPLIPLILRNEFKFISPYKDFEFPEDMTPTDMEVNYDGKSYKIK